MGWEDTEIRILGLSILCHGEANGVTTAPILRKPPQCGKVPYRVCQGPIVDSKDEAVLCESKCGLWFHALVFLHACTKSCQIAKNLFVSLAALTCISSRKSCY